VNDNIFIAGHGGMVGSAVLGKLKSAGHRDLITRSRSELDLTNQSDTFNFFKNVNIDVVVLCAAKVGGILANDNYKADFISDNIQIGSNIVNACHEFGVRKLINLGSSCIYPKNFTKPIKEEDLLSGYLEPTNEAYAIAKIATLKMCQSFYDQHGSNFYSLMPCNLYGPNDNFDLKTSHVLPALINKVHRAKTNNEDSIELWGSGEPLREFLFCEDLADAILFCMKNVNAHQIYSKGISHINCGSEDEISILNLLLKIKKTLKYKGEIIFDKTKPDGTYRKKMNNSRLRELGFSPQTSLDEGIAKTYSWFLKNS
jgi:GDP-L-fucose synthase